MQNNTNRHQKAFTLVETSIVLIIMGLVAMMLFPAMTAVHKSFQTSATRQNLQAVMRATAAYVQSQGCLPCPTPPTASGSGFGRVGGSATAPSCGICNTPEGIPPFAALGIPHSLAKDGWGHWITMRIDPKLAENSPRITPPTSLCTNADVLSGVCSLAQTSQKGLCKAGLSIFNTYPTVQIQSGPIQPMAIVLVSHGANGYGSFISSAMNSGATSIQRIGVPNNTTPTCAQGPESCNASFTRQFLDAEMTDSYDDFLFYMDRNALISLLGQGSCQTTW